MYRLFNSYILKELQEAHDKRQTLAEAAVNMGLSLRQTKRLSKNLKLNRPNGLISKKFGKKSNHQLPHGLKEIAIGLIADHYADFGPRLAHEQLTERHGLRLSISTVRQLMMNSGLWEGRKRRKPDFDTYFCKTL